MKRKNKEKYIHPVELVDNDFLNYYADKFVNKETQDWRYVPNKFEDYLYMVKNYLVTLFYMKREYRNSIHGNLFNCGCSYFNNNYCKEETK